MTNHAMTCTHFPEKQSAKNAKSPAAQDEKIVHAWVYLFDNFTRDHHCSIPLLSSPACTKLTVALTCAATGWYCGCTGTGCGMSTSGCLYGAVM